MQCSWETYRLIILHDSLYKWSAKISHDGCELIRVCWALLTLRLITVWDVQDVVSMQISEKHRMKLYTFWYLKYIQYGVVNDGDTIYNWCFFWSAQVISRIIRHVYLACHCGSPIYEYSMVQKKNTAAIITSSNNILHSILPIGPPGNHQIFLALRYIIKNTAFELQMNYLM